MGGVRGVREPQPQIRQSLKWISRIDWPPSSARSCRCEREDDGALTVHYDGTIASLRVVAIAEGLELVSLTQILAWDLPLDAKLADAGGRACAQNAAGHGVAGG